MTAFLRTGTRLSNLCISGAKRTNTHKLPIPQKGLDERKRTREDAPWQPEDLICHLMNLADDLQTGLAQGTVAPKRCRR